jgi:putative DNA-binding protein
VSAPASLRAIQRDVFRALEHGTPNDPAAARHVRGARPLGPAARLRIYSDQYPMRLHDALYEDHPKLVKLLGERKFHAMAAAYGRAKGSRHYSLGAFGAGLSRWLAGKPRGFARPDLADLAAFEWALTQSFLAEDAGTPVTFEAIAALGPERFPTATVRLAPSVRLLPLRHDVVALAEALEADRPAPKPAPRKSVLLVWRNGMEVFHAPATARDARALARVRAGRPLAEVCAAYGTRPEAAQAAFGALSLWAREQMLRDLQPLP